jgi:uncharacterized protein (DUF2267 family)
MSTGLDVFDTTVQHTNLWLKDIMQELGVDRHLAYKVLSATLHALRDRIGPENAVHLGAQLPMLMRGFYYEGWRLADRPARVRHLNDFLEYIEGENFRGLGTDSERAVRAVFAVMANRLDAGEVEKIIKMLPEELRGLFPTARGAGPGRGGDNPAWRQ